MALPTENVIETDKKKPVHVATKFKGTTISLPDYICDALDNMGGALNPVRKRAEIVEWIVFDWLEMAREEEDDARLDG